MKNSFMKSTLIKRQRYKKALGYNVYLQLWFNFHHLFFGSLIFRGKKISAFNKIINLKLALKIREDFDPFFIFLVSMMRMQPQIVLVPMRRSGVISEVPFPITPQKQLTLAVRWLIKALKNSSQKFEINNISNIMVSSIYKKGPVLQRRFEVHKRALFNKSSTKFLK
jgi:ribosomal protein S7